MFLHETLTLNEHSILILLYRSARIIQNAWRSLKIKKEKLRILQEIKIKQENAAIKIQNFMKMWLLRTRLIQFKIKKLVLILI